MRAILDTSVLIGEEPPSHIEAAISVASIAELHFGVLVAGDDDERAVRTERLGAICISSASTPATAQAIVTNMRSLILMQIPFTDTVLSRLGRRGVALDLIEEIEDETVDALTAPDLLSAEPTLLLQKMENRLVRHHLSTPDVLSGEDLRKLRYILNFARLADFEPGAAGPGGSHGRGDISVVAES